MQHLRLNTKSMKTNHRLLEKCTPARPVAEPAKVKTVEGQTFRLELQPKNVNCCAGCDVDRLKLKCSDFSECTKTATLYHVWKIETKYTKTEFLKAAEIGEVSMIDAKHVVSLLDEAKQIVNCK